MFRPGPLSPIRRSDLTPQERGPREGERANQPGMTFAPQLAQLAHLNLEAFNVIVPPYP